eukprot:CAMPEP_0184492034 /NCGR_PEP_ID=MMETSP0113_2-20130426/22086_1 /TAXON_ID=91329 /ORGANISM="Norrisiella sphaerica, Strain BC52" /LENGTH=1703 /DNA_ID=CAMNT_0026876645 /DNA_START=376 /DNA_END=5487 /DNA_ORIENTATION=-
MWFDVERALMQVTNRTINYARWQHSGLRSVAFHTGFAENGLFYTAQMETRPSDTSSFKYLSDVGEDAINSDSTVIEWVFDHEAGAVDVESHREMLRVGMPVYDYPIRQTLFQGEHLYIAHGDGSASTGGGNNTDDALGKILRIKPCPREDADGSVENHSDGQSSENKCAELPYTVEGNPYVGVDGYLEELFAVGFRDPNHIAFTNESQLIVTDAGRDNLEEINCVVPGGNYGWSERLGTFLPTQQGNKSGLWWGVEKLNDDLQDDYQYPCAQWAHTGKKGDQSEGTAGSGGFSVHTKSPLQGIYLYFDFPKSGSVYYSHLSDMFSAVTGIPADGSPGDLTQAPTYKGSLYFKTEDVIVEEFGQIYPGNDRVDLRVGQGASGELYISSKRDGSIYLIRNSIDGSEEARFYEGNYECLGGTTLDSVKLSPSVDVTAACKSRCSNLEACAGFIFDSSSSTCVFRRESGCDSTVRLAANSTKKFFAKIPEYIRRDGDCPNAPETPTGAAAELTKAQCEEQCAIDDTCVGFSYKEEDSTCILRSESCKGAEGNGFNFYEKADTYVPENSDYFPVPFECIGGEAYVQFDVGNFSAAAAVEECQRTCAEKITSCAGFSYSPSDSMCVHKTEANCGTSKGDSNSTHFVKLPHYEKIFGDCLSGKLDTVQLSPPTGLTDQRISLFECKGFCAADDRCRGFSYRSVGPDNCILRNASCLTPIIIDPPSPESYEFYEKLAAPSDETASEEFRVRIGNCVPDDPDESALVDNVISSVASLDECQLVCLDDPDCAGVSFEPGETCIKRNVTCTDTRSDGSLFYERASASLPDAYVEFSSETKDCEGGDMGFAQHVFSQEEATEELVIEECQETCSNKISGCVGFSYRAYVPATDAGDAPLQAECVFKSQSTCAVGQEENGYKYQAIVPSFNRRYGDCLTEALDVSLLDPTLARGKKTLEECKALCIFDYRCRGFSFREGGRLNCIPRSTTCLTPLTPTGADSFMFYEKTGLESQPLNYVSRPVALSKRSQVNPCQNRTLRTKAPGCGNIVIPSGFCSTCNFRLDSFYGLTEIPGVEAQLRQNGINSTTCDDIYSLLSEMGESRLGQFRDCSNMYDVLSVDCVQKMEEYVQLNPCDVPRAQYLKTILDFASRPLPLSSAEERQVYFNAVEAWDFTLYATCEACCDCNAYNSDKYETDPLEKYDIYRGNCYAHPRFDICQLYPAIQYIGETPVGDPDDLVMICPVMFEMDALHDEDFLGNSMAYSSYSDTGYFDPIEPFLEGMWNGLHCGDDGIYQSCFDLECSQARITTQCQVVSNVSIPSDITGFEQPQAFASEVEALLQDVTDGIPRRKKDYHRKDEGKVRLSITASSSDIQISNYVSNSFRLSNEGEKALSAVFIDFSNAVLSDVVCDPDGSAGDSVFKGITIDTNTNDLAIETSFKLEKGTTPSGTFPLPSDLTLSRPVPSAGYRGVLLEFPEGGFEQGVEISFSFDMDPNSIAGSLQEEVSGKNTIEEWDAGGVSGSECIASSFYAVFDDGSTAEGWLGSDMENGGSHGEALLSRVDPVQVQVHATTAPGAIYTSGGPIGTYGVHKPLFHVTGPAGQTVRIALFEAFQPVIAEEFEEIIKRRLEEAHPAFPVNNFATAQFLDVEIGEEGMTEDCLAGQFNFTGRFHLAFTAAPIDIEGYPIGPVSKMYILSNGIPVEDICPIECDADNMPLL